MMPIRGSNQASALIARAIKCYKTYLHAKDRRESQQKYYNRGDISSEALTLSTGTRRQTVDHLTLTACAHAVIGY